MNPAVLSLDFGVETWMTVKVYSIHVLLLMQNISSREVFPGLEIMCVRFVCHLISVVIVVTKQVPCQRCFLFLFVLF